MKYTFAIVLAFAFAAFVYAAPPGRAPGLAETRKLTQHVRWHTVDFGSTRHQSKKTDR